VPVESNTTAITVVKRAKPQVYAPAPARRIVRTGAMLDVRGSGDPDEFYPETSRRLEESGTALIYACSGATGRVEGTPRVEKSSGSARLDQAAVRFAMHARYHPATEDGKPIPGCVKFNVVFRLTD
jgi:periplasmic protein TonB